MLHPRVDQTVRLLQHFIVFLFMSPSSRSPGCFSAHFPVIVRNWVLLITLRMITNISFGITMPSMHQFITTPTAEQLRVAAERNASKEAISGGVYGVR